MFVFLSLKAMDEECDALIEGEEWPGVTQNDNDSAPNSNLPDAPN